MSSPQRTNMKVPQTVATAGLQRRINMPQTMQRMNFQQNHTLQALAAQAQTQNPQQIQNQVQQQQNPGINQGQVQQQASQIHMTPNQGQAQLNPGTKRGVEGQAINQNINQQSTSPAKRQRLENSPYVPQRQQLPNQQGQITINQNMPNNMILTTPFETSASPDLSAKRQAQLTNGKPKGNNQQLQLGRSSQQQQQQQVASMNKTISHVNHQMNPMGQNQIRSESELANQITSAINSANVANETLNNNFLNMQGLNNQVMQQAQQRSYMIPPNVIHRNKLNQNMLLEQKQREQLGIRQPGFLYLQQQQFQHPVVPQQIGGVPVAVQHQQRVKNDPKNSTKTPPTQSQPQAPSVNQSNAIATPQQQPIVTSGVQTQSQQSAQTTATTDITDKLQDTQSSSLNMSVEEAINFSVNYDLTPSFGIGDINDIVNFDDFVNFDELGSSSNAEPSASSDNA
ncbi:hypothetical protein GLOIN_2v1500481, partial [Rhizophagus irregularis DAOM 181602=DAOM 197198]